MSEQRTLQKYMDDWKRISHFDFCLLQEDNSILVTTCDRRLPAEPNWKNSETALLFVCQMPPAVSTK